MMLTRFCLFASMTLFTGYASDAADVFCPVGSSDKFVVTQKLLSQYAKKPAPKDSSGMSAVEAKAVASRYHKRLKMDHWLRYFRWTYHRAILTSSDEGNHWYWVITYKGVFDSKLMPENIGGFSYAGPTTYFNHYPVMMDRTMPPATPKPRQKTVSELLDDLESGENALDFNAQWPNLGIPDDAVR